MAVFALRPLSRGNRHGVEYDFHNGLLDLELPHYEALTTIEHFRLEMKVLIRSEFNDGSDKARAFSDVHRMSRMCYELSVSQKLTNIDYREGELLYGAPHEERFEWLFSILNDFRHQLRKTECSIMVADHLAKNVEDIMTC